MCDPYALMLQNRKQVHWIYDFSSL
ncbi:hypothetical protein F383_19018 [Gossypium arboreum]|uniref:Uncharacterized protein n=1 Tax=Gossypium arboreum TaxID=29729 RepID=A0A0B0NM04_GOSAR|nr:hypothetical protein F383_19018 [Gossypium arboreum]